MASTSVSATTAIAPIIDVSWLTADGIAAQDFDMTVLDRFQQCPKQHKETDDPAKVYAKIPSPAAVYAEILKIAHVQSRPSQQPRAMVSTAAQNHNSNNRVKATMQTMQTVQIMPSKIIYNTLLLLDGTLSLLNLEDQIEVVRKFQHDMVKNLDNDRNLYKAMGLHRKKTLTIDGMKNRILSPDLDTVIDDSIWLYIARLLQREVHVVHMTQKTHNTYSPPDTPQSPAVTYIISNANLEVSELKTATASITDILTDTPQIRSLLPAPTDVMEMSLSDIRAWIKFLDIKECKTKAAMSAALAAAFVRPASV